MKSLPGDRRDDAGHQHGRPDQEDRAVGDSPPGAASWRWPPLRECRPGTCPGSGSATGSRSLRTWRRSPGSPGWCRGCCRIRSRARRPCRPWPRAAACARRCGSGARGSRWRGLPIRAGSTVGHPRGWRSPHVAQLAYLLIEEGSSARSLSKSALSITSRWLSILGGLSPCACRRSAAPSRRTPGRRRVPPSPGRSCRSAPRRRRGRRCRARHRVADAEHDLARVDLALLHAIEQRLDLLGRQVAQQVALRQQASFSPPPCACASAHTP